MACLVAAMLSPAAIFTSEAVFGGLFLSLLDNGPGPLFCLGYNLFGAGIGLGHNLLALLLSFRQTLCVELVCQFLQFILHSI